MKKKFLLLAIVCCALFSAKSFAQDYELLKSWNFKDKTDGYHIPINTSVEAEKLDGTTVHATTDTDYEGFVFQATFYLRNNGTANGLYQGNGGGRKWGIQGMKAGQRVTIVTSAGSQTLVENGVAELASSEADTLVYNIIADGTLGFTMTRYFYIYSVDIESPVSYEVTKEWNFKDKTDGYHIPINTSVEAEKLGGTTVHATTDTDYEGFVFQATFYLRNNGTANGLYQGNGGGRKWGIQGMKAGQRVTIVTSAGSQTLVENGVAELVSSEADTLVYNIIADGTLGFTMTRYFYIYNITIESKSGAVIEPKLSVSGVQGIGRLVQMKSDTPDGVIKYAIGDSEEFVTYKEPVLINDTTTFTAYTEKNGKQSDIINETIAAGTTIPVNAPVITLTAVNGTTQTFSVSSNNSNVLLTPTSILTYTLPDGSSAEYAEPITVETSGYLTVVASAEGYDSAEASVYVDSKMDWIVTKNYDFTNWAQATIDRMVEDSIWTVAYTEEQKLASITRDNPYIWCDSTAVAEFEGLSIGYNTMILYFDAEGKCTGLHNQSAGGRDVIVSGVSAGQFVEYVVDGTSYFVKAAGNTCTYNQTRYTKLQKINVYTPDMIIDADTRQITTSVAGSVVVNYDTEIDVEQTSSLAALNEITLVRTFGENYTAVVFPYVPASIKDANDNVLTIGQDIILKEWNTTNQEFVDGNRIIAGRSYVLKVSEALIGKPVSFVSVSKTAALGIVKSNQNKPSTGVAFRNNQILSQEAIEGTTYAINDLGTAFVKVTDATYAPYTSFFMVADDAIIENDEILIDKSVVNVDTNSISAIEIVAVKGGVMISAADDTLVQIYSADGTLVNKLSVVGSQEIALIPGLYIINGEKVMVK